MSIPSKRKIQNEIRKLRIIIDNSDEITSRIAYAVETALRWSVEDTEGWQPPSADVFDEAHILKTVLKMST